VTTETPLIPAKAGALAEWVIYVKAMIRTGHPMGPGFGRDAGWVR
jgi:hypothetical protein